jgi:hypothetical protein
VRALALAGVCSLALFATAASAGNPGHSQGHGAGTGTAYGNGHGNGHGNGNGNPGKGKGNGNPGKGKGKGKGGIISTPATAPLQTGIFDPLLPSVDQAEGYGLIHAAGATYVRVVALWYRIAPTELPLGFDATNPDSPGYSWASVDSTVAAVDAAGLTPILDIGAAPAWAIVPSTIGTGPGTPQAQALGDFATAVAIHFDGNHGAPAVHVIQVWNEPNHRPELSPVNGAAYRGMVNAVAAGVHGVDPSDVVVAGGLDPRGTEAAGGYTQAPLAFMRAFLCVSSSSPPSATCKEPVHMDAWSTHPYTYTGPTGKAKGHDNVSVGDLGTMHALLQAGVKLHQIVSAAPVQFWVTEFGWDTSPPRPSAAPAALGENWADESFHQMWLSGVSVVTWFMLEDQGGVTPWQSGLYYHSTSLSTALPKPMLTAFAFPFVASLGKGGVSIWGRDPTSSAQVIAIQLRKGSSGSFKTVAQIKANKYGIFVANLPLKATPKNWLRATAGSSSSSLPFPLKPPSTKRKYSPWGSR